MIDSAWKLEEDFWPFGE